MKYSSCYLAKKIKRQKNIRYFKRFNFIRGVSVKSRDHAGLAFIIGKKVVNAYLWTIARAYLNYLQNNEKD